MKKFILCLLFAVSNLGLLADIVKISPAEKPIEIEFLRGIYET